MYFTVLKGLEVRAYPAGMEIEARPFLFTWSVLIQKGYKGLKRSLFSARREDQL